MSLAAIGSVGQVKSPGQKGFSEIGKAVIAQCITDLKHNSFTADRAAQIIITGQIKHESLIQPLIYALNIADNKSNVVGALALQKHRDVVKPLVDLMNRYTTRPEIAGQVALALGENGDKSAVPLLIECLEKQRFSNRTVVGYVAKALGQLGDKRAVQPLLDHIKRGPWRNTGDGKEYNQDVFSPEDAGIALEMILKKNGAI